jgi:hypothetical protein
MADQNGYTFDYVTFGDLCSVRGDFTTAGESSFSVEDTSYGYFIFHSHCPEEVITFSDQTFAYCDFSTVKVLGDQIAFADSTFVRGKYTPKTHDVVTINDETTAKLFTYGESSSEFSVRNTSKGYVTYPTTQADNAAFEDSTISFITTAYDRIFKNSVLSLVGTTEQTVYYATSPSREATILNLTLCNRILSDIKVDVIMNIDGTDTYLIRDMYIPQGTSYVINNSTETSLQFNQGDNIRVVSDIDNSLDAYAAIMEKNIR